ncbi:hypothetical protein [Hominenteromicrobium sp.]
MKSEPNRHLKQGREILYCDTEKLCYNEIKKFSCIEKLDFGGAQWKIRIF